MLQLSILIPKVKKVINYMELGYYSRRYGGDVVVNVITNTSLWSDFKRRLFVCFVWM